MTGPAELRMLSGLLATLQATKQELQNALTDSFVQGSEGTGLWVVRVFAWAICVLVKLQCMLCLLILSDACHGMVRWTDP